MLLNIDKLREANIDNLEDLEIEVLEKVFKKTDLDNVQKTEIDHLYKICFEMVEYIQTKDHNVNFVSYVNDDLDGISVSMGDFEFECGSHKYFIQQNDCGYTFEEMKEILFRRINQMHEDFFKVNE